MTHAFQGIQANNRKEFFMLLVTSLQAVFIGAFVSLFSIGSHVLFLQAWYPENLPQAFVISGVFGTAIFSVYSYLNSRISFRSLAAFWLFILFGLNAAFFIFYDLLVPLQFFGIPLMLPYTLCIPMIFLVMLITRRVSLDVFSPWQYRKYGIIIRSSFIGGIIGASYALVAALYISWDILLILAFSTAFMGLSFFIQLIINRHHKRSGLFPQPSRRIPLRSKFYEIFYTRYTLLLLIFVLLSAVAGFLIHYHFVAETRINFSNSLGLAKFFGV